MFGDLEDREGAVVPLVQVRVARARGGVAIFLARSVDGVIERDNVTLSLDDPTWQSAMDRAIANFAATGKAA